MLTEKEIKEAFEEHSHNERGPVLCSLYIPDELLSNIFPYIARRKISIYQYITEVVFRELIHPRPINRPQEMRNANHIEITWRVTLKQFDILQNASASSGLSVRDYVLAALLADSAEHSSNKTKSSVRQTSPDKLKKVATPKIKPCSQSFLCNMRIGSVDKLGIQKAVKKEGTTFQQFALKAVERRLNGEPPLKRLRRKQLENFDAVITCRFTESQRRRVHRAAKLERVSITDFVLGAIFGDYQNSKNNLIQSKSKPLWQRTTVPKHNSRTVQPLFNKQEKVHSQTRVPKSRKFDSNGLKEFFEYNKREQTFPSIIWIDYNVITRLQAIASKTEIPFQQLVLERVFRRLIGCPPLGHFERVPFSLDNGTVFHFRLTRKQWDVITKASLAAGTTLQEYILDAVYGNYTTDQAAIPTKKDGHLFTLTIGRSEKERLGKALEFWGASFDNYVRTAVGKRLRGERPRQLIPCSMFPDTFATIRISQSIVTDPRVIAAAQKENETVEDYIRFAIFGSYWSEGFDSCTAGGGFFLGSDEVIRKEPATPIITDKNPDTDDDTNGGLNNRKAAKVVLEKEDTHSYRDYAHADYEAMYRRIVQLDNSLVPFIDEIRRIKPPQHGEFASLYHKAKDGDDDAQKRIKEMYLRTAVRIAYLTAKKFDLDISDCISEACIGLLNAIDKAEPVSGRSVATTAAFGWRIRNRIIQSGLLTDGYCVRLPVSLANLFYSEYVHLKEKGCLSCHSITYCMWVRRFLSEAAGRSDDLIERFIQIIASRFSLDPLQENRTETSLDDEENWCVEDECGFEVPDPKANLEQIAIAQELRPMLHGMLNKLGYREKEIVELRYGLGDGYSYTLEEVGHIFKLSRERIRQIEAKAFQKLRQPKLSRWLVGHID